MEITRRKLIELGLVSGAGLYAGSWGNFIPRAFAANSAGQDSSPLRMVKGPFTSGQFNGDDITRPHDILWNKESYIRAKGGRPTSFDSTEVVIAGGGMSGLLAAYRLRDKAPVLLEQAPTFGGNSQGEQFGGTTFSLGAAYLAIPDPGGEIDSLLKTLGLSSRQENPKDGRVFFNGGLKNIWAGETDPAARDSILKVTGELARIYNEEYPDIPWTAQSAISWNQFKALDQETAYSWLQRKFPGLHAHVLEYFQLYAWSSLAGSLEEISAAQFLNFVCAETDGLIAFPGGNSAIAAALWKQLPQAGVNLQSYSFVIDMKNVADGVEVLYENNKGELRLLKAKAAVVAAPKYVARYLIPELDTARDAYWKQLSYRAYVVANILLKAKPTDSAFDCMTLEGQFPPAPTFGNRTDRPFTDFIFADWANVNRGGSGILTFYKPYPFEGARSLITSDAAHARIVGEIETSAAKLLAALKLPPDALAGIRLTRWGHALPLAAAGALSDGSQDFLRAPLGRIAFANQDNYLNPAFETCFGAAMEAEAFVRGV